MGGTARRGFVVALTGGIGSGKTTVSDRLAALGATVIDADVIARTLTAPGGEALGAVARAFGPGVICPEGGLDRAAMRRLVFADRTARRRLEAILHPRIRARMLSALQAAGGPYSVLVIPLLFETGQTDIADRILVVDLPERLQIARVKARSGMAPCEIRRILDSQAGRQVRLAGADDVVHNTGTLDDLHSQVDALHRRYLRLARGDEP
jgi:dephospho-CoA kinase